MTAQPYFDGTFSLDAVAAAAHALVAQLHDEAMATIAALAEDWARPVADVPAVDAEEPVTYTDPATWSVTDDEDDLYGEDEEDDVRVLPLAELPPLLLRRGPAVANVTARLDRRPAMDPALAVTDVFAVPTPGDRQFAAS